MGRCVVPAVLELATVPGWERDWPVSTRTVSASREEPPPAWPAVMVMLGTAAPALRGGQVVDQTDDHGAPWRALPPLALVKCPLGAVAAVAGRPMFVPLPTMPLSLATCSKRSTSVLTSLS